MFGNFLVIRIRNLSELYQPLKDIQYSSKGRFHP